MNAPLQAWIGDTCTIVAGPADLDAVLDRVPSNGMSLVSEDGVQTLFVNLAGHQSGLTWEDATDILLSWGPLPPGAPPGQTFDDAEDAFADPWFAARNAEPFEISEDVARQAAHEFLRTGLRPTIVQWVEKP
ncbi:Imm1 family immunity protein [Micromonospora costi]|uniref:Immunity protein Imm1 n=1 Tax=Micromonospora costi TaxID=1530042 RepID=A0A3B0A0Y3_9ACTN|nr:Imm1 family immunity protein [Micromonospora costi]RKN53017.1 hypothetical protein D7193_24830 [Micromonospora costi]